mgnify:CR=1 FL=1
MQDKYWRVADFLSVFGPLLIFWAYISLMIWGLLTFVVYAVAFNFVVDEYVRFLTRSWPSLFLFFFSAISMGLIIFQRWQLPSLRELTGQHYLNDNGDEDLVKEEEEEEEESSDRSDKEQ